MAVTAFKTNTETNLANIAADMLAKDATLDDSAARNEEAQMAVWWYVFVRGVRARQRSAAARKRTFDALGPHTAHVMMIIASMHEELFNEAFAFANSVDDPANDDPWGTNLVTQGTGPQNGPLH